MKRLTILAALSIAAAACSKSPADGSPAPGASPAASTSASGAASASAAPAATASVPTHWSGTYKSAAGTLYIPSDPGWKHVHWSGTESTAGIGEGTLSLTVDPSTGRVQGTLDGPLGPATVDGVASDGKLAGTIRRRDPDDHGFTGTLEGSLAGDHGEGTIKVSLAEVSALRTATFTLTSGPGNAGATAAPAQAPAAPAASGH